MLRFFPHKLNALVCVCTVRAYDRRYAADACRRVGEPKSGPRNRLSSPFHRGFFVVPYRSIVRGVFGSGLVPPSETLRLLPPALPLLLLLLSDPPHPKSRLVPLVSLGFFGKGRRFVMNS